MTFHAGKSSIRVGKMTFHVGKTLKTVGKSFIQGGKMTFRAGKLATTIGRAIHPSAPIGVSRYSSVPFSSTSATVK